MAALSDQLCAPAHPPIILVIDDDATVIETFSRMLQFEGYNVCTALDAESGFREVVRTRPDAILLDLRIPLKDGLWFLKRLRAYDEHSKTPVAIITGDYLVDDTVSSELRALGAELYFKPFWLEDLTRVVKTLLRH